LVRFVLTDCSSSNNNINDNGKGQRQKTKAVVAFSNLKGQLFIPENFRDFSSLKLFFLI